MTGSARQADAQSLVESGALREIVLLRPLCLTALSGLEKIFLKAHFLEQMRYNGGVEPLADIFIDDDFEATFTAQTTRAANFSSSEATRIPSERVYWQKIALELTPASGVTSVSMLEEAKQQMLRHGFITTREGFSKSFKLSDQLVRQCLALIPDSHPAS